MVSYGYMHNYVVDSDFGVFQVTRGPALRRLIREIGAIAKVQNIERGRAYLEGIRNAASKPVEFGANIIAQPVDIIGGILEGGRHAFRECKSGNHHARQQE